MSLRQESLFKALHKATTPIEVEELLNDHLQDGSALDSVFKDFVPVAVKHIQIAASLLNDGVSNLRDIEDYKLQRETLEASTQLLTQISATIQGLHE
jgi:hypothetical protein